MSAIMIALWGADSANAAEGVRASSRADLAVTDLRRAVGAVMGLAIGDPADVEAAGRGEPRAILQAG